MRIEAKERGYDFNRRFRLPEPLFAASGGGVPLMLTSGTLIGTAGVSGLPDVEDHRLITTALARVARTPRLNGSSFTIPMGSDMPYKISFQLYSARNFPPIERQLEGLAAIGC